PRVHPNAPLLRIQRNSLLQHRAYIRHRPCRSTEVERAVLRHVRLHDILERLTHAVLDIDLLRLIAGERTAHERDDAGGLVRFPFLAVKVFFALVAGAHVKQDAADFDALLLLPGTVLDESAEGSESSSETGHN